MEYQTLYRKWRPQVFEDIVGQSHITQTLMNAISLNRISHAYVFSGPRGVGKTTTARILAKALNCAKGPTVHPCNECTSCLRITEGYSMDVIEIDGASNRGIDDVRELRSKIKFAPVEGRYKVYIIDEVHMLTTEAFNALLKTLEEPPPQVIFIFATTAPHKIPNTILSRCQWFNFRRMLLPDILSKLKTISKSENLKIDEESLKIIARYSSGSMRDAESTLDQVIAYCGEKIDARAVREVLGVIEEEIFYQLVETIIQREVSKGIEIINQMADSGKDPAQFVENLMEYLHNLSLAKYCTAEVLSFRGILVEEQERWLRQASLIELEELLAMIDYLAETERKMRYTHHPWILLEMWIAKFTLGEGKVHLSREEVDQKRKKGGEIIINSPLNLEGEKEVKPLSQKVDKGEGEREKANILAEEKEKNDQQKMEETKNLLSKQKESTGIDVIELEKVLTAVLAKIKQTKISLYSFIMASNSLKIEGNKLIIGFNKQNIFHKESLEKRKNKALLEELVSKEIGKSLIVECVLNDGEDPSLTLEERKNRETTLKEGKKGVERGEEGNDQELFAEDLLIKESLRLFEGEIREE